MTEPPLHRGVSSRAPLEVVGALHVHTVASDGGGTVDDVFAAARSGGLDFVLLSDHNEWGAPAWAYRDSVLLIVGEEVNTPHGHLVVAGGGVVGDRRETARGTTPEHPRSTAPSAAGDGSPSPAQNVPLAPPGSSESSRTVASPSDAASGHAHPVSAPSVRASEGLRIAAHPTGRAPWTGWDGDEFDGIEIWNADTERRGDGWADWMRAVGLLPLRPMAALYQLLDYPAEELALWDRLLAEGPVFGVCAVDAHHTLPLNSSGTLDLHFPAYRHSFAMARQHVLLRTAPTGDPRRDGHAILAALAEGRSYCAFDGLADARGAVFTVESGPEVGTLGDSVAWRPDARLKMHLPDAAAGLAVRSRVLRDGKVLSRRPTPGQSQVRLPGPGIYRVEVLLERRGKFVPWILGSPIWVTAGSAEPSGR